MGKSNNRTDPCTVDGCEKRQHSRGWCQMHYLRHWKYGDVHATGTRVKDQAPCVVGDCDNTMVKLKLGLYCEKHYYRVRANGDPSVARKPWASAGTPEERFWEKVDKSEGEDSCWPWLGNVEAKNKRPGHPGYGKFSVGNKNYRAHRFSYELHTKVKLTPAVPVHHTCGNSLCVNPAHLQATTQAENTAEMLERRYYVEKIAELEAKLAACTCG